MAAFITIIVAADVKTQRQTAKRPARAGLFFAAVEPALA
jgi:hypothetical protein